MLTHQNFSATGDSHCSSVSRWQASVLSHSKLNRHSILNESGVYIKALFYSFNLDMSQNKASRLHPSICKEIKWTFTLLDSAVIYGYIVPYWVHCILKFLLGTPNEESIYSEYEAIRDLV